MSAALIVMERVGGMENFNWYTQPSDYILGKDRDHFILAYKLFYNQLERKKYLGSKKMKELNE